MEIVRWRELLAPPPTLERLDDSKSPGAPYEIDVSEDPFAISPRVTVLDRHGNHLFGPPVSSAAAQTVPIIFGDEVVGNLQVSPLQTLAREVDTSFAQEQNDWYLGSALAAILLAGILAAIFARPMLLPILELTRGHARSRVVSIFNGSTSSLRTNSVTLRAILIRLLRHLRDMRNCNESG